MNLGQIFGCRSMSEQKVEHLRFTSQRPGQMVEGRILECAARRTAAGGGAISIQ